MPSLDVIRRLTTQAEIIGAERVVSALGQIAGAEGDVARAGEQMAASTEKATKAVQGARQGYESFQRTVNPLQKDVDLLERGMARLQRAWAQGLHLDRAAEDMQLLINSTRQAQQELRDLERIEQERAALAERQRVWMQQANPPTAHVEAYQAQIAAEQQLREEAEAVNAEYDRRRTLMQTANPPTAHVEEYRRQVETQKQLKEAADEVTAALERQRVMMQQANPPTAHLEAYREQIAAQDALRAEAEKLNETLDRQRAIMQAANAPTAHVEAYREQLAAQQAALEAAEQVTAELERQRDLYRTANPPTAHVEEYRRQVEIQKQLKQAADDVTAALEKQRDMYRAANPPDAHVQAFRDQRAAAKAAAEEMEGLQKTANELRQHIDPLGEATKRYNADLVRNQTLLSKGVISNEEFGKANEYAASKLQTVQKGAGVTTNQLTQMTYQLNDIASGVLMGQSPFTIIAQQGGQVVQTLQGPQGIINSLKGFGNILVGMVAPAFSLVGAIGGVGAALAAVAYFQNNFAKGQNAVTAAMAGAGRASGATREELNNLTEAMATTGRISIDNARDMEVALLRTGNVEASVMAKAGAIVKDYAATTGQTLPDAMKELTQALADPARGIDVLQSKTNAYNGAQREFIQRMAEQGNATAAQKAMLGGLVDQLVKAESVTTGWQRATDALSRSWSFFKEQTGKGIDFLANGPSRTTQIANLQSQIDAARKTGDTSMGGLLGAPPNIEAMEQALTKLKQLEEQEKATAASARELGEANKNSVLAEQITKQVQPAVKSMEELQDQAARLNKALNESDPQSGVAPVGNYDATKKALLAVNAAMRDVTEAGGPLMAMDYKIAQAELLREQAITATTVAQRADIAAQAKRNELFGQVVAPADRLRQIEDARKQVLQENAKAVYEANQAQEDATRGSSKYAEALAKAGISEAQATKAHEDAVAAFKAGQITDVDLQTRLNLRTAIAEANKVSAESTRTTNDETTAREALNKQVKAGVITTEEAERRLQMEIESRKLAQQAMVAEGDQRDALLKRIDELKEAYKRGLTEKQAFFMFQGREESRRTAEQLGVERDMLFSSDRERAVAVETLKAEQDLKRQGINTSDALAQQYIRERAANADLTVAIEQQRRALQEVLDVGKSFGSTFVQALMDGKTAMEGMATAGKSLASSLSSKGFDKLFSKDTISAFKGGDPTQAAAGAGQAIGGTVMGMGLQRGSMLLSVGGGALAGAATGFMLGGPVGAGIGAAAGAGLGLISSIMGQNAAKQQRLAQIQQAMLQQQQEMLQAQQAGLDRAKGFVDSLYIAAQDADTEAGALAIFERQAQRQREAEVKAGGQAMTELEANIASGREGIIKDFAERAKASQAEMERSINAASGKGFLNDFMDLFAQTSSYGTQGLDPTRIQQFFSLSAQKIVDDAQLTGEAFNGLLQAFPQLTGVVHQFTEKVDEAARAEAALARGQGFLDRIFNAANDNSTFAGALAAQERAQAQEREDEIKAGGEKILELEAAQYAERVKLIQDFNDKAAEAERQRYIEARQFLDQFSRTIQDFLLGLRTGAGSPLSPSDRLSAAQQAYNAQLAKAQGGDRDALNGITKNAQALIDAARAMYASSPQFQAIFDLIQQQLGALPGQVTPEQLIVNAITDERNVLKAAIDAGPVATAVQLKPLFQDNTAMTWDEFKQTYAGTATEATLHSVFNELDINGDGTISKLEDLISAEGTTRTTLQKAINDSIAQGNASAIATALTPLFDVLDTNTDNTISFDEMKAALGGMATDAQLRAMFTTIDADNSGSITKLELIRAATDATSYYAGQGQYWAYQGQYWGYLGQNYLSALKPAIDAAAAAAQAGDAPKFAQAVTPLFNTLDTDVNQLLDFNEMRSALSGMVSDSALYNMFTRIDTDNSGSLSKLELIRASNDNIQGATTAVQVNTDYVKQHTDETQYALNNKTATESTLSTLHADGLSDHDVLRSIWQDLDLANWYFANGVNTYAFGGWVRGAGTGTSDSIRARVSNGEYIMDASNAATFAPLLEQMSEGRLSLPMIPIGNDNMVSELRALRAEVANLKAVVAGSGANVAVAVVQASERHEAVTKEGFGKLASETRMAAKQKAA